MRFVALAAALLFGVAGCVGSSNDQTLEEQSAADLGMGAATALEFTPFVVLNTEGYGYEPSIAVDPFGNAYVTAHKADITHEGTRLSSWLWYSTDDGATWQDVPSPQQVHESMWAGEGDLAVDAEGRLYYVDTYLADNTAHRWSTSEEGPTWDFSRPIQATTAVDDRPWLAAHGDGIAYYLGNSGAPLPAPNNLLEDGGATSRIWAYTSTDGGMTWSMGHGFADSDWCTIDASKADDQTVLVGCTKGGNVVAFLSNDRGMTWSETIVSQIEEMATSPFAVATAIDAAGDLYLAWTDDDNSEDGIGGGLFLARSLDAGASWEVLDLTDALPETNAIANPWITGGEAGTVAITLHVLVEDTQGVDDGWYPYALVASDAASSTPVWSVAPLTDTPVSTREGSPGDFFQNDIGPDNVLHVAFQIELEATLADASGRVAAYNNDIVYVRQALGPNMPAP